MRGPPLCVLERLGVYGKVCPRKETWRAGKGEGPQDKNRYALGGHRPPRAYQNRGKGQFCSRALESTSSLSLAAKASKLMTVCPPWRLRTATPPVSASLSPTTSI